MGRSPALFLHKTKQLAPNTFQPSLGENRKLLGRCKGRLYAENKTSKCNRTAGNLKHTWARPSVATKIVSRFRRLQLAPPQPSTHRRVQGEWSLQMSSLLDNVLWLASMFPYCCQLTTPAGRGPVNISGVSQITKLENWRHTCAESTRRTSDTHDRYIGYVNQKPTKLKCQCFHPKRKENLGVKQ